MNTPKSVQDLRRQTLVANSPNTPLRRRSGLNVTNVNSTSLIEPQNAQQVNDDEAERRNSRIHDGVDSITSLKAIEDSVNNCMKLFNENKISKDNAWTLNIIDSFSKLIRKHHFSLQNFQTAGSTLEASTKVYSLRVDSVYADVLRMSTDLSRQTAKALNKKNRLNLDDEESDRGGEDGNDKENIDGNQEGTKNPKEKPKKKRRAVATVTKNPESLNARLDTHPLVDPFFAKLNSMVGDINSSKRLMQHILPTKESNLKLCQNMKIWEKNDHIEVNLDEPMNYKDPNHELDIVAVTSAIGKFDNNLLRNGLKSYRICDLPMENSEEADMSIRQNDSYLHNQTILGRNASNMDLQFDINAEVEPVSNEKSFVMDFGDMDDHDFVDVEEDQLIALNRCKGLKRQPILIEDMQPETSAVVSDYSYRPLDMIDQFWAGPSHWKFRQSRRTHATGMRPSQASVNNVSEVQVIGQKPKTVRKKKIIRRTEVVLEDAVNADDFDSLFTQKGKSKNTQITVPVMTKRWDCKKLKLPIDHQVPSDIFNMFSHAKTIQIATNPDVTFNGTDHGDNYNYDNEDDRNYCSRVADVQSDTETETNTDMGQMDNNMEFDMAEMGGAPLLPLAEIDEIPDYFIGAPDRIEKISIAFARRAKVVDMKQLKQCSWNLISRKQAANPLISPCFSEILRDLPKILTKTMAENMSMPLAFYAILHLCNDKGLLLKSDEDLKDFEINFVN